MVYLYLAAGLAILIAGGELLVRYTSRLARTFGVSPLVIGLTIVAFGTSAPELMTSVYAQWVGESGVAIGNVVGSNIFNVLGILGISAIVAPLMVDTKLLRIEIPVVLAISVLVAGLAYSGSIARWESGLLLIVFILYTGWIFYDHRTSEVESPLELEEASEIIADEPRHWSISAGLSALGLLLVVVGGRLFVSGAVELARSFHIDETVIALTIVACGTSTPELVTSIMASLRGHREIAVGNVVGSNLFNLTCVLGISGLVAPGGLEGTAPVLSLDMPVMIAAAIVCGPVMVSGGHIDRWEGGIFVGYYVGYLMYLVLNATDHPASLTMGRVMLWGVVPLTLLTIAVIIIQQKGGESASYR